MGDRIRAALLVVIVCIGAGAIAFGLYIVWGLYHDNGLYSLLPTSTTVSGSTGRLKAAQDAFTLRVLLAQTLATSIAALGSLAVVLVSATLYFDFLSTERRHLELLQPLVNVTGSFDLDANDDKINYEVVAVNVGNGAALDVKLTDVHFCGLLASGDLQIGQLLPGKDSGTQKGSLWLVTSEDNYCPDRVKALRDQNPGPQSRIEDCAQWGDRCGFTIEFWHVLSAFRKPRAKPLTVSQRQGFSMQWQINTGARYSRKPARDTA